MSNFAGKQTRSQLSSGVDAPVQQSVGKRTLVEQVHGAGDLQMKGTGGEAGIHEAASRGIATPSSALPNQEAIQRSFGRHDVSGVQAHVGDDAAASARSMKADGFASGNHVVLAKSDLFTEAHEAAHVVQQRGGVQLKGGVGQVGDPYEQHADQVASLVVQGKSAESLLDAYAGGSGGGPQSAGVGPTQLKLSIGGEGVETGTPATDVEALWAQISQDPRLAELQGPAKELLTQWITKEAKYKEEDQVSENRHYKNTDQLIRALVGDLGAAENLAKEGELATATLTESSVNATLETFLLKLATLHMTHKAAFEATAEKKGRYAASGWNYNTSLGETVANAPQDLYGRITFIADYALTMRRDIKAATQLWDFRMSAELTEGRHTHHNTNEDSSWVQEARVAKAPVSAGPSATTAQVLALGIAVGASEAEMESLAWALFCLWNMMPLHKSGTHRFHEVMAVAKQYDVKYEKFTYSAPPKNV
jgi:Domain of unknown function (DUF4157)